MDLGPFIDIPREEWSPLATWQTRPLSPDELSQLRGVLQALSLAEVEQVYLPLARLARLRLQAAIAPKWYRAAVPPALSPLPI